MLSKTVFDAMWTDFDNEFGELSEHDEYLRLMTQEAVVLMGGENPAGDSVTNLISAASRLGFIIGIRTGADMMNTLPDTLLPQQILESSGDWRP